jgi:hypothetical protein
MIASYPSPLFGLGNIVIGIAVWLATGLGLHWAARYMLDGLSDDDN